MDLKDPSIQHFLINLDGFRSFSQGPFPYFFVGSRSLFQPGSEWWIEIQKKHRYPCMGEREIENDWYSLYRVWFPLSK